MITLQWHRLADRTGATYFRLFEEGKRGGDWVAGVDHTGGKWVYTFNPPAAEHLGWGQTGSPVRSRRLAGEALHAKCYAIWGDDISIKSEIHNG